MEERRVFDYARAFSRNIGWVTRAEQERLRRTKVAIAGAGGVGGTYALTLARLGVGRFSLADFDDFEVHNFNRQVGAMMSTLGRAKVEVMAEMIRDINPEAEIEIFEDGVTRANVDAFLRDADAYADGVDVFALPARRMLFGECFRRGIPAVTAAPLGMGVAMLYFKPGAMSFEQYFRLEGHDEQEQYARFIAGLSPAMLQRSYLVDRDAVNFAEKRGPSTMMSCTLCAGVMGTTLLKILLDRGPVRPAPWGMQFDAYRQRLKFTWRPGGNSNPLQWLMLKLVRPVLRGRSSDQGA